MTRRDVLSLLGGIVLWPPSLRAQQDERVRRIGVLMNLAADDPLGQSRRAAFGKQLEELGWTEGHNVQIETRWGAGDADRFRTYAAELVALAPDVLLAASGATMPALMEATRTIPIIFALVPDPVGSGFVASLARPGGNATGFTQFEFGLSGKWLEILKEIAPNVKRAAILRDPADPAGIGQFGALQAAAPTFGIEVSPVDVRDPKEIERALGAFAQQTNGGMIVTGSTPAGAHRNHIIRVAARHRLPAVYAYSYFPAGGGLASYGPDTVDLYRRAAVYVDRILKGERPGDLPVQAPTKYDLVINFGTAKALGLAVPPSLLARADRVIE